MSYGARCCQKALLDTRAYWTAPRVTTTIAAPIVAAILWTIYRPWSSWSAIVQIAAISILGFFALWGVVFVVLLTLAPSRLDADAQSAHIAQISGLEQDREAAVARSKELEDEISRKHPHDVHLEARISDALKNLNETEQAFIGWLLDSGRVSRGRIQGAGFRGIQEELNHRAGIDLITHEIERSANGSEVDRYHQINPSCLSALRNVLHPGPPPR